MDEFGKQAGESHLGRNALVPVKHVVTVAFKESIALECDRKKLQLLPPCVRLDLKKKT